MYEAFVQVGGLRGLFRKERSCVGPPSRSVPLVKSCGILVGIIVERKVAVCRRQSDIYGIKTISPLFLPCFVDVSFIYCTRAPHGCRHSPAPMLRVGQGRSWNCSIRHKQELKLKGMPRVLSEINRLAGRCAVQQYIKMIEK